jgi:hypothetical protein
MEHTETKSVKKNYKTLLVDENVINSDLMVPEFFRTH